MEPKHLCLLILATVACAGGQSEDEFNIPVENDNQFPPENNSLIEDLTTQSNGSLQPEEDLSYIPESAGNLTTEAPAIDTTASLVEDTEITSSDDNEPIELTLFDSETSETVDEFVAKDTSTTIELVNDYTTPPSDLETLPDEISPDISLLNVEEITTSSSTEEPVDGLTVSYFADNEDVQMTVTELDIDQTSEGTAFSDTIEEQISTTESSVLEAEPSTTESTVLDSETPIPISLQGSIDTTTTLDDSTLTTGPESTTTESETISNNSDTNVAILNAMLPNSVDLTETQADTVSDVVEEPNGQSESDLQAITGLDAAKLDNTISLELDAEPRTNLDGEDVPIDVGNQINETGLGLTIDSVTVPVEVATSTPLIEELTETNLGGAETTKVEDLVVPDEPVLDSRLGTEPSVTEVTTSFAVNEDLITTTLSVPELTKADNLEAVNPFLALFDVVADVVSESANGQKSEISEDPSEFSMRSNKEDAVSPLTLHEGPMEADETDTPKDTVVDNKQVDVSVGAATSVNKAGGVDKSVIGIIVAGMVLVVAGITIKKNWKSIKNKFSSTPRPANDRVNHTNGIAPEEVPLQNKDDKNPSPV